MARRTNRKLHPAPMSLYYQIGDNTLEASPPKTTYIDLAKDLSNINRRFYRQGMNYAVAGFRIGYSGSRTNAVDLAIQTLPTTWVVGASWHKFFAAWQNQQNEALEGLDALDTKGRWNDFKIYFDAYHKAMGNEVNVVPGGFVLPGQVPHNQGEWDYSQIVVPQADGDSDEFSLHMVGDDATGTKAIIKQFGLSRNFPQSPDPVQGNVESSVLSEMTMVPPAAQDDVVQNATDFNDELPYNQTYYVGGEQATLGSTGYVHREITLTNLATSQYTNIEGCVVPCGLLKISHNAASDESAGNLVLQVMLVPGNYKGYLAEPMQEMN